MNNETLSLFHILQKLFIILKNKLSTMFVYSRTLWWTVSNRWIQVKEKTNTLDVLHTAIIIWINAFLFVKPVVKYFFYLLGMNKVPDMKRIRDVEARSGKLLLLTEVHCKPLYFILPLYTSIHMFKRKVYVTCICDTFQCR